MVFSCHPVVQIPVTVHCVYQDIKLFNYLAGQTRANFREKCAEKSENQNLVIQSDLVISMGWCREVIIGMQ